MQTIYDDDFDNLVASLVYYAAVYFIKKPLGQRAKKSAAILTAGGKGNEEWAHHHLQALFKMLNARGLQDHIAYSPNTDTIPASEEAPPEFTGFNACGYRK